MQEAAEQDKKKFDGGKTLGLVFLTVFVVLAFWACSWIDLRTPVKNTPQEYAYHMQLFEEEVLLGKTKNEICRMIGYPDNWKTDVMGIGFGNGAGPWDENMHAWFYVSKNSENAQQRISIFFSNEDTVEEVTLTKAVSGGALEDIQVFNQGNPSEYNY